MCSVCKEGQWLQMETLGEREARSSEADHLYLLEKTDWPLLHSPLYIGASDIFREYGDCPHAWPPLAWKKFTDDYVEENDGGWVRCDDCVAAIRVALLASA